MIVEIKENSRILTLFAFDVEINITRSSIIQIINIKKYVKR